MNSKQHLASIRFWEIKSEVNLIEFLTILLNWQQNYKLVTLLIHL